MTSSATACLSPLLPNGCAALMRKHTGASLATSQVGAGHLDILPSPLTCRASRRAILLFILPPPSTSLYQSCSLSSFAPSSIHLTLCHHLAHLPDLLAPALVTEPPRHCHLPPQHSPCCHEPLTMGSPLWHILASIISCFSFSFVALMLIRLLVFIGLGATKRHRVHEPHHRLCPQHR